LDIEGAQDAVLDGGTTVDHDASMSPDVTAPSDGSSGHADASHASDAGDATVSADSGNTDSGVDAPADVGVDAPPDVGVDAGVDAGIDAGVDAGIDAGCTPLGAPFVGQLALSMFSTKGTASWNENNDARITLTNSNNNEAGAAWYPTQAPVVVAYDLTWSLRVGPTNTAGDGIAFAMLEASAMPGVGDNGDGLGLRNLPGVTGYAVVVDMFKNPSDPTDLAQTTLKLFTMPGFMPVAETGLSAALNDGKTYAVDVSWRAPSTLTATLHGPNGSTTIVTSSDPGLTTTTPAWLGFTGATGGTSDSHNEVTGITITDACQ
jgi:hypothetical protein